MVSPFLIIYLFNKTKKYTYAMNYSVCVYEGKIIPVEMKSRQIGCLLLNT